MVDKNMEKVASRLYKGSLKYYQDREFWKAARELIILLDYYPQFSDADGVLAHLGECMYAMEMYKSASKMFRFLLKKYPESQYVAQGLYGLQRIHYQTENHDESIRIYHGILQGYPKTDLLDGINYFGGMAYFHKHDYDNAIASLGKVRSRSEFFDYSLYTVGLSYLKSRKKKVSTNLCMPCAS